MFGVGVKEESNVFATQTDVALSAFTFSSHRTPRTCLKDDPWLGNFNCDIEHMPETSG